MTMLGISEKTSKVSGFRAANKPVPLRDEEAERILGQVKEGVESVVSTISFEVGETVKVADGLLHHSMAL